MDISNAIKQYNAIERHKEGRHGFGRFSPKAVLFDMDGVLYDSMRFHAKAWHESMRQYGIAMSEAQAYEHEGMRGMETIREIALLQPGKEHLADKADEIYKVKSALFASYGEPSKMKGVEELMRQMKADGMTICVVTGSGQHSLLDRLERDFPDLLHRELMVTCFDVSEGKPKPYPYLQGLAKCGVEPWEAIVVENAPLGVQASVAAEIFTVAVNTGPLHDDKLLEKGANLLYHTMDEFHQDWTTLLTLARDTSPNP
ncbi:MAG: HAD hydrolase-like protein [Prevotella sp.]|nr:HAD hydrolase-like protein [Prevotella sp.]MBR7054128.1 HAD hydrolase-like protein [Prevotella sp.]